MGRIVVSVDIQNVASPQHSREINALVDTAVGHLVLPNAWRDRFGSFDVEEEIETETAAQEVGTGLACGPARIRIGGFRVIHGEVLFVEMTPVEGKFEPLLGHIPLGQCGAAVDFIGQRILSVKARRSLTDDVGESGAERRAAGIREIIEDIRAAHPDFSASDNPPREDLYDRAGKKATAATSADP